MTRATNPPQSPVYYQAFLIRMWRSAPEALWRASAQHTQTGETVMFANLESLFLFLHSQSVEEQAPD